MIGRRVRAGAIVIVDHIDFAVPQVRCALEVLDDVVAKISDRIRIRVRTSSQRRVTFAAAGQQVVMQRDTGG